MPPATIKRFRDLSEAIVAQSVLEAYGIVSELCDENLARQIWHISNFIGGIRLQVAAEDEQDAIAILDAPPPDSIDYGAEHSTYAQSIYPRCASTSISFEGSDGKAALASLYLVSMPLPLGTPHWVCGNCEKRWQASWE
jgi:hypothetical protein